MEHVGMTGTELRRIRATLGWTQEEMARRLGYSNKHGNISVMRWETGKTPVPGHVAVLARGFEVAGKEAVER